MKSKFPLLITALAIVLTLGIACSAATVNPAPTKILVGNAVISTVSTIPADAVGKTATPKWTLKTSWSPHSVDFTVRSVDGKIVTGNVSQASLPAYSVDVLILGTSLVNVPDGQKNVVRIKVGSDFVLYVDLRNKTVDISAE